MNAQESHEYTNPEEFAQLPVPAVVFPGQAEDSASVVHRAWELLEDRAPREALELLEPAIEAEPDATSLRMLRAWAYFMRAQYRRARPDLEFLIAADPTDVWALHTLGRSHERDSDPAGALAHLRLAAAMSDDPVHHAAVRRVEHALARKAE